MPLPDNPDLADSCANAILTERRKGPLFREQLATVIRSVLARQPVPSAVNPEKITAEMIYMAYPRKVGKTAAVKVITRLMANRPKDPPKQWDDREPLEWPRYLMERTQAFAKAVETWPTAERHYCPHPATWFNQGRFDDDPKEWVRGSIKSSTAKPATL